MTPISSTKRFLKKYWIVWWTSAKLSASSTLASRGASLMFLLGKVIRFIAFIYFLFVLNGNVKQVAGYDLSSLVGFFLIFNVFDMFGQIFFRGIYWFRRQVISGEFDFRLVKPISPLFQALTRQTDFLDIPLLIVIIIALFRQGISLDPSQIGVLLISSLASIIIITAIHIAVAALGVLTTEVDHTMLIYRDLSSMARFPTEIYADFIRALLTFVIPMAVVFSFPAKAFLKILNPTTAFYSLIGAGFIFLLCYKAWTFALTKYSSASS